MSSGSVIRFVSNLTPAVQSHWSTRNSAIAISLDREERQSQITDNNCCFRRVPLRHVYATVGIQLRSYAAVHREIPQLANDTGREHEEHRALN